MSTCDEINPMNSIHVDRKQMESEEASKKY
jgi:hypothetical protein